MMTPSGAIAVKTRRSDQQDAQTSRGGHETAPHAAHFCNSKFFDPARCVKSRIAPLMSVICASRRQDRRRRAKASIEIDHAEARHDADLRFFNARAERLAGELDRKSTRLNS